MSTQSVLGIIATLLALSGYVMYFRDIFAGRTKPHAFSWLVWGILTGIGFASQVVGNAGPGAWVTGFSAGVCGVIFLLSLSKGEKKITLSDWLCLFGALIAIICWLVTSTPLYAVFIIILIDSLGMFPTLRKSYRKPNQETLSTYLLSGLKFVFGILALQQLSTITMLYPLWLVFMNWGFVIFLIIRRRQLKG